MKPLKKLKKVTLVTQKILITSKILWVTGGAVANNIGNIENNNTFFSEGKDGSINILVQILIVCNKS
jgi:hypothetical protein